MNHRILQSLALGYLFTTVYICLQAIPHLRYRLQLHVNMYSPAHCPGITWAMIFRKTFLYSSRACLPPENSFSFSSFSLFPALAFNGTWAFCPKHLRVTWDLELSTKVVADKWWDVKNYDIILFLEKGIWNTFKSIWIHVSRRRATIKY